MLVGPPLPQLPPGNMPRQAGSCVTRGLRQGCCGSRCVARTAPGAGGGGGWQTDAGRACAGGRAVCQAPPYRRIHGPMQKRPREGARAWPPQPGSQLVLLRDSKYANLAVCRLPGAQGGQSSPPLAGPTVVTCRPDAGDPEPRGRHRLKRVGTATRADWPADGSSLGQRGQGISQDPPRAPNDGWPRWTLGQALSPGQAGASSVGPVRCRTFLSLPSTGRAMEVGRASREGGTCGLEGCVVRVGGAWGSRPALRQLVPLDTAVHPSHPWLESVFFRQKPRSPKPVSDPCSLPEGTRTVLHSASLDTSDQSWLTRCMHVHTESISAG